MSQTKAFLKYPGGKRTLVTEIEKRLPARHAQTGQAIQRYWEPFLGGGSVFFALHDRIEEAELSDISIELILTYKILKANPQGLLKKLRQHQQQHEQDEKYYYQVREQHQQGDPAGTAARTIYLNKTAYNGLRRFNRQGRFNVPKGKQRNPKICDEETLMAAHRALRALRRVHLSARDFTCIDPGPGDFVYCDPPYDGTFTGYSQQGFRDEDQQRLRDQILHWHKREAQVMISNADTEKIRALYRDPPFHIHEVEAQRSISRKADGRKKERELLITTYPTHTLLKTATLDEENRQ